MPKAKNKRKNNKLVKPILRVFCEGEKTEPLYIQAFIESLPSTKFGSARVEPTKKNTPIQLVEDAIKHKSSNENNDIYWVVYDRENENKYSDSLHLEARQKADSNNINIAVSNVCFEYWLLLHFQYTASSYTCCEDLLRNSDFKKHLNNIGISDYDKGMALIFDKLKDKVSCAIQNAKQLRKDIKSCSGNNLDPHKLNPYTDVDILLEDIENFLNPFNHKSRSVFESEFSNYYSFQLPEKDWVDFLTNEASQSAKRLMREINTYHLITILNTLMNVRNHEFNKLTAESCKHDWINVDKEWSAYKKLIESMKSYIENIK